MGGIVSRRWTELQTIPADTELLLTKNYNEKLCLPKLRISSVITWKGRKIPQTLRQIILRVFFYSSNFV